MKLVRLTLFEKFRGLEKIKTKDGVENFSVIFREDQPQENWGEFHPFCFAGLNGSGKSNVLEALANIFHHLECCTLNPEHSSYLSDDFNSSVSDPLAYELEYFIIPKNLRNHSVQNYVNVFIKKEKDIPPKIKITEQGKNNGTDFIEVTNSIRTYLPELVIGYSSGENEILSLPFVKSRLLQLDEYLYHLKAKAKYNLEEKPESSLVYMDSHMSQAILLANFLLQDEETIEPIKNQLEIDKLHSFRLVINNLKLCCTEKDKEIGYLLPLVEETLKKLKKCATTTYKEKVLDEEGNFKTELMDFYVNDATKAAFKKHFGTPLNLFKAFQVLALLDLRVVDENLKKEVYNSSSLYAMLKLPRSEEKEHVFYFNLFSLEKKHSDDRMLLRAFSDGEHQFLHTMGICLMLKDKNTLFLLDEPETHFNPEWRSEFISLLKKCLNHSGVNHLTREIIITSHSPFIISDCYPDKVIVFKKNEQPQNAFNKNFRTFGTSVDIIMENIFKRNNTIGDLSASIIKEIEKELDSRHSLSAEEVKSYKNRTLDLGDSMEKILLFARLNELKKNAESL